MVHLQQNKYTYHILCDTDICLIYFKLIYGGRQSNSDPIGRLVGLGYVMMVWLFGRSSFGLSTASQMWCIILFTTISYVYI